MNIRNLEEGRRKPCLVRHCVVFGIERLWQYVPEKGDREDRLVVKLLY